MVLLYAWDQAAQTKLGKLLILQESSLPLIHFSPYRSCDPVIQLNKNFQYCKSVCTIMHEVSNNSLPANISNLFLYRTQEHSFNTRFSDTGSLNIKSNQIRFPKFFNTTPSSPGKSASLMLSKTCKKHFILS